MLVLHYDAYRNIFKPLSDTKDYQDSKAYRMYEHNTLLTKIKEAKDCKLDRDQTIELLLKRLEE